MPTDDLLEELARHAIAYQVTFLAGRTARYVLTGRSPEASGPDSTAFFGALLAGLTAGAVAAITVSMPVAEAGESYASAGRRYFADVKAGHTGPEPAPDAAVYTAEQELDFTRAFLRDLVAGFEVALTHGHAHVDVRDLLPLLRDLTSRVGLHRALGDRTGTGIGRATPTRRPH